MEVDHCRRLWHLDAGVVAQEQVGEHVGAKLVEVARGVGEPEFAGHGVDARVGGRGNVGRQVGGQA
ncbi:hypothetical protein BJF85_22570 [Saccharomonospora sp. CUA-673]|nr:hypothetical protein BJF85_22570 [Saccharomonospora sp. CUA-673]